MTHVVEAPNLLRGALPASGCIVGSVTVAVLFGQHVFEHELTLANLMRLVDPKTLCRAEPSPRWQLRAGVMTHLVEEVEDESDKSDESDDDADPKTKKRKRGKKKKKPKKRVGKAAYETTGRYVNSMEAFAEYEEVSAVSKAADAKKRDEVVAAHRDEIVKKQAVHRDSLLATYATYHLGDAMSMVLAQCLQRLSERQSIDQVWVALYRNAEWLRELESTARKAGNETLSETACKLRTGQM